MAKKALIFGISGQTGSYLGHLLLAKGYEVVGTSRNAGNNNFANLRRLGIRDRIELLDLSLLDGEGVARTLTEVRPDETYNLAGQSSVSQSFVAPVESFESIALGTLNVLEALRRYEGGTRYFNATSSDCFGSTSEPANEATPFRPRSPYAMAKAASFWAVASYRDSYGIHVCNGILSNHESPLRPTHFLTQKIVRAALRIASGDQTKLLLGNIDVERDWGWAPDFADAIWRVLQRETPSDFVIATGKTTAAREFVDVVFSELGLSWRDHIDIDPRLFRPSEIPRVVLNPHKSLRDLSWSASLKMPELALAMLRSEQAHVLGPVPWIDGQIADMDFLYAR